jgi:uncharacterized protein
MKTKIFFVAFFFFLFFPALTFAQTIPNLPTLQKYVNDNAKVLTSSDVFDINNLAAQIEANSTVEVAVLTINSTQPYAIQDYALQVFRANGVGKQQNSNGILIVVAVSDRQYFIATGYGLEGLIPDAKAGDIGRACFIDSGYFKSGEYGKGISCAVQDIGNVVENQPEVIASATFDTTTLLYVFSAFGIFLVPVFAALIYFAKDEFYQKCPKDGTRMHMHITKQGIVYECPKCHLKKKKPRRTFLWMWFGGMGGGWGGGGGGGFGGGSSGGGGAGGGW